MNAPIRSAAPALVMMGVCGSGKTTVGSLLAERLGVSYRDADEFHPPANVAKMSAGIPLHDDDRWPWLDAIAAAIRETPPAVQIVVSCSALRRIYRERIVRSAERQVRFVHLHGPRDLLIERMTRRAGHFMPVSLLDSQLELLELPGPDEPVVQLSIELPVERLVTTLADRLGSAGPAR
jgi:gluconokinase